MMARQTNGSSRFLWCVALLVIALSQYSRADVRDDIASALTVYNRSATTAIPVLNDDTLAALARGDTVSVREALAASKEDETLRVRVVGMQLVPRPRLLVWLATLFVETQHEPRLTEHRLQVNADRSATWYQYLDAPWPMRNRHWVIRSGKNPAIAQQTDGLAWQHEWALEPDGPDIAMELLRSETVSDLNERDGRKAIYLPENAGAWTMFDLGGDNTLVVTYTMADMGGWIPDRLVTRFVTRQLRDVLSKLAKRADTIHERYDPSDPVLDGYGVAIDRAQMNKAVRRIQKTGEDQTAGGDAS
ncbi:MAG: hypothetical protein AAF610_04020 [Pseudomonadota bacterium]